MGISQQYFGTTKGGEDISLYRLEAPNGAYAEFLNYGCVLRSLVIPNAHGGMTDVCLGYDTLSEYEENEGNMGAIVGRYANRIGGGVFSLDGVDYRLAQNDGENHLHGGTHGFDKQVWSAELGEEELIFSRTSPDGEEGYPGNLSVRLICRWEGDGLSLNYQATTDRPTVLNLTNHAYFNLDGQGDIYNHKLQIHSDSYTQSGETRIPTGGILHVAETPLDFRQPTPVGLGLLPMKHLELIQAKGYDLNYILPSGEGVKTAARLWGEKSGICMTVLTDQPGMQLYTANFLTQRKGKGDTVYTPYSALCLETQHYPDSMAHGAFPTCVLRPDEHFETTTVFSFQP